MALAPGDLLVVFTDGVTEAPNAAEKEFGEERLEDFVRANAGRPVDELCRGHPRGGRGVPGRRAQHDDMTLVVARVR